MNPAALAEFLGWCTILNIAMLAVSALLLSFARAWAQSLHARLFDVEEKELRRIYLEWLGRYKMAIFVFNLMPWLALKIMA